MSAELAEARKQMEKLQADNGRWQTVCMKMKTHIDSINKGDDVVVEGEEEDGDDDDEEGEDDDEGEDEDLDEDLGTIKELKFMEE